ncbi:hypothetical protein F5I97DRAFT_1826454 [Phlebopus sp. FC_14]|nr:hypothetical protein F5I97DRAFT_1826454 [Phlebopus sp. FC_14]
MSKDKHHDRPKTTALYEQFKDELSGIDPTTDTVDTDIDGTYHMAAYYSPRMDDGILEAIRQVARIHLSGHHLSIPTASTSSSFLARLRCVDSLSDDLILSLQAVAENKSYTLEPWIRPDMFGLQSETGALEDEQSESDVTAPISLVHISDLMAHSTLKLSIPTQTYTRDSPPPYCFVSHSWVDKDMPDTKDGKFYKCLLLLSLAIYIDTGIQHFWIDYLCVTQNPSHKALKAAQLRQIPSIIQHASTYTSICLEIYQYYSSAWCALETLLFIAQNARCHPLDFIRHLDKTACYRFGMNVVDPSKVNANEKMIFSFTDQPLACGSEMDVSFLDAEIERAKVNVMMRLWRLASRTIKAAVGLSRVDTLGLLITEPVLAYLKQDIFSGSGKTAREVVQDVSDTFTGCGMDGVPDDKMEEIALVLEQCGGMFHVMYFRCQCGLLDDVREYPLRLGHAAVKPVVVTRQAANVVLGHSQEEYEPYIKRLHRGHFPNLAGVSKFQPLDTSWPTVTSPTSGVLSESVHDEELFIEH